MCNFYLTLIIITVLALFERYSVQKFRSSLQKATTVQEVNIIAEVALFELRVATCAIGLCLGILLYRLIKEQYL